LSQLRVPLSQCSASRAALQLYLVGAFAILSATAHGMVI
jgi:hypothetical protein